MKRPSRERERPANELDDEGLEPRAVARRSGARPAPRPASQSWFRRYWVSIFGVSIGMIVSIWRFGFPEFPRSRPDRGPFGPGGPRGNFAPAVFNWNGPIAAGAGVEVRGMNGAVHAFAADDDQLHVTAVRRSQGRNPAEVPIAVVEEGGNITICPASPGAPLECASGDEGNRNGSVSIEYTLRVPKGVEFSASTVNGGITVEGLDGAVDVETVNGGIEIATAGSARAETVNGSIRASVGSTTEDLSFETVNGSISVSLPADAAVDVDAQTLSGNISSDFPLNIPRARPGQPKEASGQIGGGGSDLHLETVNGSIALQKAGVTPARAPRPPRPPQPPRPPRGEPN